MADVRPGPLTSGRNDRAVRGAPQIQREVHLWYTGCDAAEGTELLRSYEALLQPDERKRCGSFRVERSRRQYLVTRALVRCVLSQYCPRSPAEWRFRSNPYGRPELDPPHGLRFNLSNCDELVVCAVADGREVGVDAEPYSRAPTVLGIAPRVFTNEELDALSRLDAVQRPDRALLLWTLKEAYAKARGLGFALPLRSFSFAIEGGRVALDLTPPCDSTRWAFATKSISLHRVSLAVERKGDEPVLVRAFAMTPLAGEPREVGGGSFRS
jgi:4'-phosphopantetheinyl transferase